MSRKRKEIPTYRRHSSGQARIRWQGRDILLGPFDSPESRQRYSQIVAEIVTGGQPRPAGNAAVRIAELVEQYVGAIKRRWENRSPSNAVKKLDRCRRSLGFVVRLYCDLPANEFGPAKLSAVRGEMIAAGYNLRHVNQCVSEIKGCWKWAAGVAELVSGDCYHRLAAFPNLRPGESSAPPAREVPPAPETAIEAVLAHVNPVVAAMIRLQLATGMRPGEVCALRTTDIDRDGDLRLPSGEMVQIPGVWLYRPTTHKTQHLGHQRLVLIGPTGQAILSPWLRGDGFAFSPSAAWGGSNERHGDQYDVNAYRRCISYAIRKTGCEHWHPHQLRHNAATRIAAEFGPEIARIVLGHRTLGVTRQYVVDDLRKAAAAMLAAG